MKTNTNASTAKLWRTPVRIGIFVAAAILMTSISNSRPHPVTSIPAPALSIASTAGDKIQYVVDTKNVLWKIESGRAQKWAGAPAALRVDCDDRSTVWVLSTDRNLYAFRGAWKREAAAPSPVQDFAVMRDVEANERGIVVLDDRRTIWKVFDSSGAVKIKTLDASIEVNRLIALQKDFAILDRKGNVYKTKEAGELKMVSDQTPHAFTSIAGLYNYTVFAVDPEKGLFYWNDYDEIWQPTLEGLKLDAFHTLHSNSHDFLFVVDRQGRIEAFIWG